MNADELDNLREVVLKIIENRRVEIFEPYANLQEGLDKLQEEVDSTITEAVVNEWKIEQKAAAEKSIDDGLEIVNQFLGNGVYEWSLHPNHDEDDWQYIDQLRIEQDFFDGLRKKLHIEAQRIMVQALVQNAHDTFKSLIEAWSPKDRKKVPVIRKQLEKATAWLA